MACGQYLALSKVWRSSFIVVLDVTGKYIKEGQEASSSEETQSEELQTKLWEISGRYTSLDGFEPLDPPPRPVEEDSKPKDEQDEKKTAGEDTKAEETGEEKKGDEEEKKEEKDAEKSEEEKPKIEDCDKSAEETTKTVD